VRTTFENALYTSTIVKKNIFWSVILVTPWDHMRRSSILLKMMLVGAGTIITPHSVRTGPINLGNWFQYKMGWKNGLQ
jgi:uncharacterized SAM-binding protein YcdF (DUF218 family)